MLDTYIKSKGISKTIIHNNNRNYVNEINWDADYDGDKANIVLDLNDNNSKQHYNIELDNENLAQILNIPSIDIPLEKRLTQDFNDTQPKSPIFIGFDENDKLQTPFDDDITKNTESSLFTHISSPTKNEEFFIPVSIDKKTNTKKHRKNKKTHKKLTTSKKSHKIYRNTKSMRNSLKNKKYSRRTL
jgi:hypothetical protein